MQEAITEAYSADENDFGEQWDDVTEEVFAAINRAYGVNEVTVDAPPP